MYNINNLQTIVPAENSYLKVVYMLLMINVSLESNFTA